MTIARNLLAIAAALSLSAPAHAQGEDGLRPQTGAVVLEQAQARMELGRDYAFYGPADTRRILVDIWGNPPAEADGVLGLVMPAGSSPREKSWGAVVTWEPIGWVSSEAMRSADTDALLARMQGETLRANDARRARGFPAVTLIGWAQAPRHDSVRHSVTWGRELAFADGGPNGLHYDLRLLGRRGVLSLDIVGEIDQLGEIRAAADDLATRVSFDPGARYADFDAQRDEAAGYGIAGLIATGAGVAVAKNVGLLAMLAKFAQPIGVALLVLAAALATPIRRWFRRRRNEPARR
ncbi:DUF2167 domain-containing protein [Erythrobacter arachoides]|uniref:DUF2167 domain-containing protein n=1 Tax=Aurantiacibacter arachoides TaxID=1850444 RepID=A0A845A094_9SPHN|nr:DUF2167 domain-containing protein [Aurantiacibacter arachoides]MXO93134.1 DUF2167 domain-containing protein [Aurantiacibacter arachoides]GGD51782.1 hypothetical protein GCM10011411_09510 [Aurantiacibacter arachoides]